MEVFVLICTRNRVETIERTLKALTNQLDQISRVIVSDSSENNLTQELCSNLAEFKGRVTYLRSEYGAPRQKNVALNYCESVTFDEDIVCFLDDDIIPNQNYFRWIRTLFAMNPAVLCLGGFDESARKPLNSRLLSNFGLASFRPEGNQILASGICTVSKPESELVSCDWVPGGMQSFRVSAIRGHRFDQRFRIHGDEVEFQTRVLRNEGIYSSKLLGVNHLAATTGKASRKMEVMYMDGFRLRLAHLHPSVTPSKVIGASFLLAALNLFAGLVGLNTGRLEIATGHIEFLKRLFTGEPTNDVVSGEHYR